MAVVIRLLPRWRLGPVQYRIRGLPHLSLQKGSCWRCGPKSRRAALGRSYRKSRGLALFRSLGKARVVVLARRG